MSVCLSWDFVILPKGIWALDRVQFSSVLWPGKRPHYFSGPKSYPQLVCFCTGISRKRGPKTGPSFWTLFCTFFASKSQFFSLRTSSHVSWTVIIRWRLRAPCLQVLSSIFESLSQKRFRYLRGFSWSLRFSGQTPFLERSQRVRFSYIYEICWNLFVKKLWGFEITQNETHFVYQKHVTFFGSNWEIRNSRVDER